MDLTKTLINAAIEVHRDKGPGLVESIYERCLERELQLRQLSFVSQKAVIIHYKGFTREEPLRFDILIEDSLPVEAKSVVNVLPIHKAQLLSYMRLLNVPVGLGLHVDRTPRACKDQYPSVKQQARPRFRQAVEGERRHGQQATKSGLVDR